MLLTLAGRFCPRLTPALRYFQLACMLFRLGLDVWWYRIVKNLDRVGDKHYFFAAVLPSWAVVTGLDVLWTKQVFDSVMRGRD